jgi:hypothetical protein
VPYLVIVIKPKGKESVRTAAIVLFYVLQKMQSVSLIFSLSTVSVAGALSHATPASAGNFKIRFYLAVLFSLIPT